ncbi:MAG: hypothetical protein FD165_471 [Gammaproteobacteria bacterium]|nr:MAG: hypothetical protein FD165_471 [Gammaproteobacteria bacterium]TND02267.1 MAG: hypothetical protein FD120_2431 [Gammaproteobacteria bacterium]
MKYRLGVLALLLVMAAPAHALTYELELGQPELQLGLEQLFPVSRTDTLVSIFLRDPKILLKNGSDRIGLRAELVSELAGGLTATGNVSIDGKLRYEPKTGAFHLEQTRINDLRVEGVPGFYTDQIRQSIEPIVRELLSNNPIYVLDSSDKATMLSKQQVKSVKVRNGKVFVELAAF